MRWICFILTSHFGHFTWSQVSIWEVLCHSRVTCTEEVVPHLRCHTANFWGWFLPNTYPMLLFLLAFCHSFCVTAAHLSGPLSSQLFHNRSLGWLTSTQVFHYQLILWLSILSGVPHLLTEVGVPCCAMCLTAIHWGASLLSQVSHCYSLWWFCVAQVFHCLS